MSDLTRTWLEALRDFFDHGASDLKTPLNTILHLSNELCNDKNLTENQQEKVNHIYASSQILQGVINDFLLLGQLETGIRRANVEPVDLHDLLHKEWVERVLSNFSEKTINTSIYLASDLPLVQADKIGLKEAIARCVTLDSKIDRVDIVGEQDGKWVNLSFISYPCQLCPLEIDAVENFQKYKTFNARMSLIIASLLIQAVNGQFTLENIDSEKVCATISLPIIAVQ